MELDPQTPGLPLCAFVCISSHHRLKCTDLGNALRRFPEIEECHSIAGEDSMLIKVRTATTADLEALLQKVRAIGAISVSFTDLVEAGRLKQAARLAAIFKEKNADLSRPITTTCGSGITAAVVSPRSNWRARQISPCTMASGRNTPPILKSGSSARILLDLHQREAM